MKLTQWMAALLAALIASVTPVAPTLAQTPPAPFERYGHVERFDIASKATGRTYRIEVWVPPGYATSDRAYPALFLLDGNYSFDAAVALSSYMQRKPNPDIEEHILVGVSSDVPFGPPLAAVRTPDFTPPLKDGVVAPNRAGPYYRFLRDELLPQVQARVRIEPAQRTLWGYSLSGSFLAWLNAYDHALFRNYIAASPNWGQFGLQQRLAEGGVFNAPGAGHKLFMSFDLSELQGIPNPEAYIRAFVDAGLPGYEVGYVITKGETHTTSWFATMPAALRFIYGRGTSAP